MPHRRARHVVCAIAAGCLAAACGGGSAEPASVKLTGTVQGSDVSQLSAAVVIPAQSGYESSGVALASRTVVCDDLFGSGPPLSNALLFSVELQEFSPRGVYVGASKTGTYPIAETGDLVATAILARTDAACGAVPIFATAGSVTVTSWTPFRGTLDLTFAGETVKGTVETTQSCPAAPGSATCH